MTRYDPTRTHRHQRTTPMTATRTRRLATAATIAALAALTGCATAAPEPATAAPPEIVTETLEVALPACIAALDQSDEIISRMADLMSDTMPRALLAASLHDAAALDRTTAEVQEQTEWLQRSSYRELARACRGDR